MILLIITFNSSLKGGDLRAAKIGLNTLACVLIKAKNVYGKGAPQNVAQQDLSVRKSYISRISVSDLSAVWQHWSPFMSSYNLVIVLFHSKWKKAPEWAVTY